MSRGSWKEFTQSAEEMNQMFMTSSRYLSIYFEKLKKFPHIVAARSELKVHDEQQKFNHIHMIFFFQNIK